MGKKRKSIATSLDEVDRTMYSTFCSAANSLSQLYSQALNHQKLSFLSGERHASEKLYQWILRQQEDRSRVTTVDILNYLESELDYNGEDQSMSPRPPSQYQQHSQPMQLNSGLHVSSGPIGVAAPGHGLRSDHDQQSKNNVFSNALSSPVRRSLQNYHISQGGHLPNNVQLSNGTQSNGTNFQQQNRDSNYYNPVDASMGMHSDSPSLESSY